MRATKDPIRVLVVEDTAEIRELLRALLQEEGYKVVLAADGFQAVDELSQGDPSLVLLDLALPGMDGIALLRWMAANQGTKGIPVIVVSASAKSIPAEARGQVSYILEKPFELNELLSKVDSAVRPSMVGPAARAGH